MTETTFSERFLWARHRSGLGANRISRSVGCSQSLISSIENTNKESSKYNDKFAELFGVDKDWLRTGKGRAPKDFDAVEAKELQHNKESRQANVVPLHTRRAEAPIWTRPAGESSSHAEQADALQKSIINDFQDYARLVGEERAKGFIELLSHLKTLVLANEEADRDNKERPTN